MCKQTKKGKATTKHSSSCLAISGFVCACVRYVCVSTKKHKATEEVLDSLECAFVIPWLLNARVVSSRKCVKTKKIK